MNSLLPPRVMTQQDLIVLSNAIRIACRSGCLSRSDTLRLMRAQASLDVLSRTGSDFRLEASEGQES